MIKGDFFIKNGALLAKTNWIEEIPVEGVVYEVIRVIDSKPLFFDEHYNRLLNSLELIGFTMDLDRLQLYNDLLKLIETNKFLYGNIMIRCFNMENQPVNLMSFIPHKYPTSEMYVNGVEVGIVHDERNMPTAKVIQHDLRKKINEIISERDVYEVLLVNHHGNITEGSRSNVFFIKNDELYTCPINHVLKGITLLKLIDIAHEHNIKVNYQNIKETDLHTFNAAFITGTSPKLLPIKNIGNLNFNSSNKAMRLLMNAYSVLIEKDIKKASF